MSVTPGSGCAIRCRPASEDALFATLAPATGASRPDLLHRPRLRFAGLLWSSKRSDRLSLPASCGNTIPSSATRSCAAGRHWKKPGLLESVGVDVHPDPDAPGDRLPGRRVQRPGPADESPLRPRLPGRGGLHSRLAEAHEGGRLHEDDAAAAHLFQLRVRSIHRREDAARGKCSKTRSRQS